MTTSSAEPGRLGRYALSTQLGEGGMGVVYLAHDEQNSPVAIKVIRQELASDPDFRVRFTREIAQLQRIDNLHVVRVLDVGAEDQPAWFAMEYVPALSLEQRVKTHGPLSLPEAVHLGQGLADALTAIHEVGTVHRDVKPANVLLPFSGPKLIDFGIARDTASTTMTHAGHRPGSPGWMAPEQITGDPTTPATDVFLWGLVLCYSLTGRSPFGHGPSETLLYRVAHQAPDLTGIPTELHDCLLDALSKDPARRPAADALRTQLQEADDRTHPSGTRAAAHDATVQHAELAEPTRVTSPAGRRRRHLAIAAGGGLLVAAAGAALLAVNSPSGQADRAAATAPGSGSSLGAAATPFPPVPVSPPSSAAPTALSPQPVTEQILRRTARPSVPCERGDEVGEVLTVDFTGDGVRDGLVEVSCEATTTALSSELLAFVATDAGPRQRQLIVSDIEGDLIDSLAWEDETLGVGIWRHSEDAPNCCPDEHWTYLYAFDQGSGYFKALPRPRQDCLGAEECAEYREEAESS